VFYITHKYITKEYNNKNESLAISYYISKHIWTHWSTSVAQYSGSSYVITPRGTPPKNTITKRVICKICRGKG